MTNLHCTSVLGCRLLRALKMLLARKNLFVAEISSCRQSGTSIGMSLQSRIPFLQDFFFRQVIFARSHFWQSV